MEVAVRQLLRGFVVCWFVLTGFSKEVRHHPQGGWLDELGRLKGGRSANLGVARCAPYWLIQNCPPAPSAASCSRMYVRTCSSSNPTVDTAYPRAQKCSPVKFLSLPWSRAIAMALFPFRNPITDATRGLGGIAMHMCTWSDMR